MIELLGNSFSCMRNMIIEILNHKELNSTILRMHFNLEKLPFHYANMHNYKIQELPRHDEKRMLMQAQFLLILRLQIPYKCKL